MDVFYRLINKTINAPEAECTTTVNEITDELPYMHFMSARYNLHNGQRKLFLSELQFLTSIHQDIDVVIYAGAAPGHHTYFLSTFFPRIKFVLVDPAKFDLMVSGYSHGKIPSQYTIQYLDKNKSEEWVERIVSGIEPVYCLQDYFTDHTAEIFAMLNSEHKKRLAYISDIRTNMNEGESPDDSDLIWNSAMQYNWLHIMRPLYFMLKFRCPFYNLSDINFKDYQLKDIKRSKELGIDFLADYAKNQFKYVRGECYLQAWAPPTSAETRLVGHCNTELSDGRVTKWSVDIQDFKPLEYEQRLFYFNICARSFLLRRNPYIDKELGIDCCQDCTLECKIWQDYSKNVNFIDIYSGVRTLNHILKRDLHSGSHGEFYIGMSQTEIQTWYRTRLNYRFINMKKISLPKTSDQAKQEKKEVQTYTPAQMFENLVHGLPFNIKEQYLAYLNRAIKDRTYTGKISLESIKGSQQCIQYVSQLKERFRTTPGMKLWRPLLMYPPQMGFFTAVHFILKSRCTIFVIDQRTNFDDYIALLPQYIPYCTVLHFGCSSGVDINTIIKNTTEQITPGYYVIKDELLSIDTKSGMTSVEEIYKWLIYLRALNHSKEIKRMLNDAYKDDEYQYYGIALIMDHFYDVNALNTMTKSMSRAYLLTTALPTCSIWRFWAVPWYAISERSSLRWNPKEAEAIYAEQLGWKPEYTNPLEADFNNLRIMLNENKSTIEQVAAQTIIENKYKNFKDGSSFIYLRGDDIYIPPYRPYGSTNAYLYREVPGNDPVCQSPKKGLVRYKGWIIDELITHYNTFIRGFTLHTNNFVDKKQGLDCCHDCAVQSLLWQKIYDIGYSIKDKNSLWEDWSKMSIKDFISEQVGRIFPKGIIAESHGVMFDSTIDTIMNMYRRSLLERILFRYNRDLYKNIIEESNKKPKIGGFDLSEEQTVANQELI